MLGNLLHKTLWEHETHDRGVGDFVSRVCIFNLSFSASNLSGTGGSTGSFDYQTPGAGNDLDDHHSASLNIETSTLQEIIDAMKAMPVQGAGAARGTVLGGCGGSGGLNFFSKVPGLPPLTFVAYEAVVWLVDKVIGINNHANAIEVLQTMLDKRLIAHASGDYSHTFVNGFFLYSVIQDYASFSAPYNGDIETFNNDWTEIKFKPRCNSYHNTTKLKVPNNCAKEDGKNDENEPLKEVHAPPEFLSDLSHFNTREKKRRLRKVGKKSSTFDMDCSGSKHSDRKEWWHLRYQVNVEEIHVF